MARSRTFVALVTHTSLVAAYRRGRVELNRKAKGDLAELMVATDLRKRGYKIAFPYGEDWDFDLILCRANGALERVQVKHAQSDGRVVTIRTRSCSLTNGKVKTVKLYTSATIDWLAAWEPNLDRCYYIPATELGGGMNTLSLRLVPTLNGQARRIRLAADYTVI
jgi:PD-(D/E)XK endonuclease